MMLLVALYDLELYQIDVEIVFFNGDLQKDIYMAQLKGFVVKCMEHM
jgi:hypothetical protein